LTGTIERLKMKILVLNGSPKKNGTTAALLRAVVEGIDKSHSIDWLDVYDLKMQPCIGCMKCRKDRECCLNEDDGHRVGRMIHSADGLLVGTPTYWGNMSSQLKTLFDRNVAAFIQDRDYGFPTPLKKGKPAAIVTTCTTPWPFNFIFDESRGAIRAVRNVFWLSGCKYLGCVVQPGTIKNPKISPALLKKAKALGEKFN
jgi:NAD(P)H-dependent FMN reductase